MRMDACWQLLYCLEPSCHDRFGECSENFLRLVSQLLDSFIGESDGVNSHIMVDNVLVVNARKS